MFISEIYRRAKRALETCDEVSTFEGITDAVRLLGNKGIADTSLGELTVCVHNGCITLPRDVGTVLGVNVNGAPTLLQDQWFQYHINGPGMPGRGNHNNDGNSNTRGGGGCGPIIEMGQVCTYRDLNCPAYLVAEIDSAADNNKELRVFAYDVNGNKIFTHDDEGVLREGFVVPTVFGFPAPNSEAPAAVQIYRISKVPTLGFVRLSAVNASDGASQGKIGYYEPNETLPTYRRIKVPNCSFVRVKYKKANLTVTSQNDFVNIDNYEALILACRAVKFRNDDKYDAASAAEAEAARIWSEQIEAQRPSGPRVPQIISDVYEPNGEDSLIYGGWGCGGGNPWGGSCN